MKTVIATALLLFAVKLSSQQCFSPNDNELPNRRTRAELYGGQQEFSLTLLNAINKLMPNENLFFSPYSTYHALLITYFMSGKQTESYLKKVLRFKPDEGKIDIVNAYKVDKFQTQLMARDAPFEFTNANRIYVADNIPIRDCIKPLFHEELAETDFIKDPEAARAGINRWVENATHNMIKDLIPPGTIDASTSLVLVNAAYFKGVWENKFDPDLTKKEVFYVSPTKQIMVDMMHVEGSFGHDVSEKLGAHILELPYQGNKISMYILLPPFTKENNIEATLKNLTLENFVSIINSETLISKTVQVALPKFSLETTVELVPVLEKIGVGDLFTPTADFSVLTEGKVELGKAIHKARIEVNEEGTKAAAASVLFSFRSSRPLEPVVFHCNHPFVYILYDKDRQSILFTGVFRRPY
ncbi:serine protease inhibitor 88Ea isoform X2 [Aethina tumida]|uniref:serine protease inhibitor 88Ea isoform X2 n=1 Tax=Aethina tumida TaxID=116153 RepID=UPI0021489881|nr:serine protease inhibitor 88Ea isoform X2 [Aethina tumida]